MPDTTYECEACGTRVYALGRVLDGLFHEDCPEDDSDGYGPRFVPAEN